MFNKFEKASNSAPVETQEKVVSFPKEVDETLENVNAMDEAFDSALDGASKETVFEFMRRKKKTIMKAVLMSMILGIGAFGSDDAEAGGKIDLSNQAVGTSSPINLDSHHNAGNNNINFEGAVGAHDHVSVKTALIEGSYNLDPQEFNDYSDTMNQYLQQRGYNTGSNIYE